MQIEHQITIQASPEGVYRFYEDVERWHTWDPDTKSATLDGPPRVGARGVLTPTKGHAVPMVVTEAERGRSFTVESRIPLFRMRFEHLLQPGPSGTEVVHRVSLSGPLRFVLGPVLAKRLHAGLPVTLRSLKAAAERVA